jgi:EAL domain-containing protein (putative c-di-GMP-specific phosphodiesterase class I)
LNVSAAERQGLEVGLRHAATRGELELHYQPKVKLDTRAIVGVEALLRWHHPARGLLSPHAFVGIAEDTGLIVPIGRWVLRESCRQAQAWVAAGLPPVKLAVNVSAVELRAKDFVAEVQVILSETGFDPTCLELEITETFLMQESTSTSETLTALKKLGMHLALDDFGTGYSSLSFVKRFPIDTLKIDQSFVRDVISDEDDASIVRAVIDMGRSLRKRVIAEGVETREQLDFLVDYGCPEAQGFYFSRPLQADKFAKLLTDGITRHKQSSFAAERANVR